MRGVTLSKDGVKSTINGLEMPGRLVVSCIEIKRAGRYHFLLQKNDHEQDQATAILTMTIEVLEWTRTEMEAAFI